MPGAGQTLVSTTEKKDDKKDDKKDKED